MYYVFELAVIIFGAWYILTQIIIPAFQGKPVFPLHRKREQLLSGKEVELNEVKTEGDIADMEAAITRAKEEVDAKIQRKYTRKKATTDGNNEAQ